MDCLGSHALIGIAEGKLWIEADLAIYWLQYETPIFGAPAQPDLFGEAIGQPSKVLKYYPAGYNDELVITNGLPALVWPNTWNVVTTFDHKLLSIHVPNGKSGWYCISKITEYPK